MFRPHKMKKVTVLGLDKDRNKVLLKLHGLEIMQPVSLKGSKYKDILERVTSVDDLSTVSEHLIDVSRLVNILKIPPRKLNFTQKTFNLEFLDKTPVKRRCVKEVLPKSAQFIKKYKDNLVKLENSHSKCLEKNEQLQETKRIIELFASVGIPVLTSQPIISYRNFRAF